MIKIINTYHNKCLFLTLYFFIYYFQSYKLLSVDLHDNCSLDMERLTQKNSYTSSDCCKIN